MITKLDPVYESRWDVDYSNSVIDTVCSFISSVTGVPLICWRSILKHPREPKIMDSTLYIFCFFTYIIVKLNL